MAGLLNRKMLSRTPVIVAAAAPRSSPVSRPQGDAARVWVLTDHKLGHTTQSVALADALGWPYEIKQLHFNARRRWSNALLGASTLSLDRQRSTPLVPPWPDLVIATGRAAAPIARWIKARSGGHARLVQLGRRGTDQRAAVFDLSVACGFFGLPPHPRRVETIAPIAAIHPDRLRTAAERWRDLFAGTPHPHVALLVGGSTKAHSLDAGCAARMARDVCASTRDAGGTLLVVTSPRTGEQVTAALEENLDESARLYSWKPADLENPYLGCLAVADVLVVTGDSESMLAEAAATTKSMYIYPLPELAGNRRRRVRAWVGARAAGYAAGKAWLRELCRLLLRLGVVRPPRRLEELHRQLIERGYAHPFGTPLVTLSRPPLDEVALVAAQVAGMMGRARPHAENP